MPSRGKSVTVDDSFLEWLDRFIDLTAIGSRRAALNSIRARWGDLILEDAKPIPVDALKNNHSQPTTFNSQTLTPNPQSTVNHSQPTANSPQSIPQDKRLTNLKSGLGALDKL